MLSNTAISKESKWKEEVILIADDDIYSSLLLEKLIRRTGAKILIARDGEEALELFEKNANITLAIVDIVMPKVNGYDVVLRARPKSPETVFIAYTADVLRLDKELGTMVGFHTFVAKPILPIKFLAIIEKALNERQELIKRS